MKKLTYLEEMRFTEHFLRTFRLRLSDKSADVLGPEGKSYIGVEPNRFALVGCLGHQPDPNFSGPQPPNSMGMVLLVTPDVDGAIKCKISGQFDVSHRYIPDTAQMVRELILDSGTPRNSQIIPLAFRRYTVTFDSVELSLNAGQLNSWVTAASDLRKAVSDHEELLRADPRVMRRCQLNPRGGAKFNFIWNDSLKDSQEALNGAVYSQIIDRAAEVLSYAVVLRARVRAAPSGFVESDGHKYLVEIYIENQTSLDVARAFGVEFPYLLDTRMRAEVTKGQTHLVPHRLRPEDYRYQEDDGLPGYGISCGIDACGPQAFETNAMPTVAQARFDTPGAAAVGMKYLPTYSELSAEPTPVLIDFLAAAEGYLGQWEAKIESLAKQGKLEERDVASADRDSFRTEIENIRDGVELLKRDSDLLRCFRWMNEAMGAAIALQGKSFKGWHLFQLGFILTQVRSIYDRHAEASAVRSSFERADVLWFATGGGKTEAYLGIISMCLLYARLKGREYGTSAWMRFPLRMLSVQQFQRLSYVLAQTNMIRQREGLGGWPFTIGYFTGEGTPNRISSTSGDDIRRGFLPALSDDQLLSYKFISDCPYCGMKGSIDVARDLQSARLKHVCREMGCWSNRDAEAGSLNEGIRGEIGIYVSDEEVYRYLPSVLVGTVDKLAVIAHNRRFANFWGAAKYYCPEHGFSQSSKCEHRRISLKGDEYAPVECGNNTKSSSVRLRAVKPLRDPGFSLLIQDELHLLKESLGNFDAHYESLLTALQIAHNGRPAKILAATATIKDFEDHVHHLYLKSAVRFPAPGVSRGESFYARMATDPSTGQPLVRRWFAGLLPIGRGRIDMQAVSEVSSRFLDQVDAWRSLLKDEDAALLSELGLMRSSAAIAGAYLDKNLNTDLIYANSKRDITEVLRYLEETNGDRGYDRGFRQLDGQTRLDVILDTIVHVETKPADHPERHIVATSVVSHGVDIAELNFMVMAGWPKSTAEYIQASARSGRVHPGVVVCVFSSRELFETNVFLNFTDYHAFIERLVDSVPINRFAPNVLDRTIPGIVSAVLLNWAPHAKWGGDLTNQVSSLVKLLNDQAIGGLASKEIRNVVLNAMRLPKALETKFDARVIADFNKKLEERIAHSLFRLERWSSAKNDLSIGDALGDIFGYRPFRSFRDIENQIELKAVSSNAENVIDALAR